MNENNSKEKKLLLNYNYWITNKLIAQEYGHTKSFLLGLLIEHSNLYSRLDKWFYLTVNRVELLTKIKRKKQEKEFQEMADLGIIRIRNINNVRNFKINYENLATILDNLNRKYPNKSLIPYICEEVELYPKVHVLRKINTRILTSESKKSYGAKIHMGCKNIHMGVKKSRIVGIKSAIYKEVIKKEDKEDIKRNNPFLTESRECDSLVVNSNLNSLKKEDEITPMNNEEEKNPPMNKEEIKTQNLKGVCLGDKTYSLLQDLISYWKSHGGQNHKLLPQDQPQSKLVSAAGEYLELFMASPSKLYDKLLEKGIDTVWAKKYNVSKESVSKLTFTTESLAGAIKKHLDHLALGPKFEFRHLTKSLKDFFILENTDSDGSPKCYSWLLTWLLQGNTSQELNPSTTELISRPYMTAVSREGKLVPSMNAKHIEKLYVHFGATSNDKKNEIIKWGDDFLNFVRDVANSQRPNYVDRHSELLQRFGTFVKDDCSYMTHKDIKHFAIGSKNFSAFWSQCLNYLGYYAKKQFEAYSKNNHLNW